MKLVPLTIPGLYLVSYPTVRSLCQAFLRFEEHYESPNQKFRAGAFSLAEFKRWYRTFKPHGRFSYYSDWGGFNLPGRILEPFYRGDFKRLSREEKRILRCFRGKDLSKVYVIGVAASNDFAALEHETAHGLFYLDAKYRERVTRFLRANSRHLTALRKHLRGLGYCDAVLLDECHAYLLCEAEHLARYRVHIPQFLRLARTLRRYFDQALARY